MSDINKFLQLNFVLLYSFLQLALFGYKCE